MPIQFPDHYQVCIYKWKKKTTTKEKFNDHSAYRTAFAINRISFHIKCMYTHTVPGSLPLMHTTKKKIMNHSHPIHPYTDDWCCDQYQWQNQGV